MAWPPPSLVRNINTIRAQRRVSVRARSARSERPLHQIACQNKPREAPAARTRTGVHEIKDVGYRQRRAIV